MSQISAQSQYTFTVTTTQTATGNSDHITGMAYSQNGMSDALASQIILALQTITPPVGLTLAAVVTKQDVTDTVYTTGYANPLTFT